MKRIPFMDLPPLEHAAGTVHLPGSKSISNRALLLAALCEGRTRLSNVLDSDDTRVMTAALERLGVKVSQEIGGDLVVDGLGARAPSPMADLFMGNAGTAMRPLVAVLALAGGNYTLDGVQRMRERPIGDLIQALRDIGCHIDYLGTEGYPPLRIGPPALNLDQPVRVRGNVSSQYLTALLMALVLAARMQPVRIEVEGELISRPYIAITLRLMAAFGVVVAVDGGRGFIIPAGAAYRSPGRFHVEGDASSASYFVAAGAIAGDRAPVVVEGVGVDAIQGDIRFVEAARAMGARIEGQPQRLVIRRGAWPLKAVDLDCNEIPDAAMTLAAMALYADGPTTLRNIASWRVKETDRIVAIADGARRLGARVEDGPDFIRIWPPVQWLPATITTYDDHRIAMCFSLAAFNAKALPVRLLDPGCVAKTYPLYFQDFFAMTQTREEKIPVITIDGPTASGKGSLAAALAARLGYHYFDSGALYRVTALGAMRQGLAADDLDAVVAFAARLPVRFDGRKVLLDGDDVSEDIRAEAVGMMASAIAAAGPVREALRARQLAFRALPGLVADGRDMGTVIFPDAPLKVFLTATAEARADRRFKQLIDKGISVNLPDLRADLAARDARDMKRVVAPLKPAAGAFLLDNSRMSIEESVDQVLAWWEGVQPFGRSSAS